MPRLMKMIIFTGISAVLLFGCGQESSSESNMQTAQEEKAAVESKDTADTEEPSEAEQTVAEEGIEAEEEKAVDQDEDWMDNYFLTDDTLSWQDEVELFGDEKLEGDKLTYAEKVELGLNPYELDNAKNGIPDWMEIEVYGTDPTKFSTAEDGISDLAKIEEGLDPLEPIDPSTIEPFTVEHDEFDLVLHTNDLNAKYHTVIRSYQHGELEETYDPVREPVQIHHYEGEVALHYGEVDDPESLTAYYFDFDKLEMIEIEEQDNRVKDQEIRVMIDHKFPIFVVQEDT